MEKPDHQTLFPTRLLMADRLRQNRLERDVERAAVVIGDPPGELENFWRNNGVAADNFVDRLQAAMRRFSKQRGDRTKNQPGTEGNFDARARSHLAFELGRNEIIELLAKNEVECNAGDHGYCNGGGGILEPRRRYCQIASICFWPSPS